MPAKGLMLQGTGSSVGKSLLSAALCRIFRRRGIRVAPFKAVNMSNNASVTREGGEIASAQAVQAKACGIEPDVRMNPVLLKPTGESVSQVILLGRPIGAAAAADFRSLRDRLWGAIEDSLAALRGLHEFIVVEGAGSPAEVNLQETDLANMRVARQAEFPVILVADIDRGGAFAGLIGTLELIPEEDRRRVKGFLINKFRGDRALLEPGIDWLERRTGRPVLGVIPWIEDVRIPEEDNFCALDRRRKQGPPASGQPLLRVQVIRYPTISNFTDFDPLGQEPDVSLEYLTRVPEAGERPHLLILPGSKSTVSDLSWLRRAGFDRYITGCLESGAEIAGVCGGFQMLGRMIHDPDGVESRAGAVQGLGLLPTSTLFRPAKVTAQVRGIHLESGEPVTGYEIHAGRLQGTGAGEPVMKILERGGAPVEEWDGCCVPGRKVWGTYLHGLFEDGRFRRWLLRRFLLSADRPDPADPYDLLADAVLPHLALDRILEIAS